MVKAEMASKIWPAVCQILSCTDLRSRIDKVIAMAYCFDTQCR